jgi:hypothetical protein
MTHRKRVYAACGITLCVSVARAPGAQAVPAFAGQTGQPCAACHVGAFGPELTPFGRAFKIGGYTLQGGSGTLARLPLAAFVQTSFTATDKTQGDPAAPHFAANNNAAIDQISIFLAGRLNDHAGGFVQATYDGIGHAFALDNTDIRLTTNTTIGKYGAILGLSLNNGPMVQDPYKYHLCLELPVLQLQPGAHAGCLHHPRRPPVRQHAGRHRLGLHRRPYLRRGRRLRHRCARSARAAGGILRTRQPDWPSTLCAAGL